MRTTIKMYISGWVLIALSACSATPPPEPAALREMGNDAPGVVALFETRIIRLARRPQSSQARWYWRRIPGRIVIQSAEGTSAEIWKRGDSGEISYHHVFFRDKKVVDYTAGDLRALGRYPDWQALASLIKPALLSRLKNTGTVRALDRQAERYQGQLDGVDYEILWLRQAQLPALVRQIQGDTEISLHLLELNPLTEAAWLPFDIRSFERLDYADLGDKEADPFVKKLLRHGH